MADLNLVRNAAARDTRRWLSELEGTSPRNTLSVGIVQQACRHAEQIIRGVLHVFEAAEPEHVQAALPVSAGGRPRSVRQSTLGECIHVLLSLDDKRRLLHRRAVVSNSDRLLLRRVLRARNEFAHGPPGPFDPVQAKSILRDVERVCGIKLVDAALRRSAGK